MGEASQHYQKQTNSYKHMKKYKVLNLVIGLLPAVCLTLVQPTAIAGPRPISDFLANQGKYCIQLDSNGSIDCATSHYVTDTTGGGCFLFVPPVANYFGWSAPTGTSASFDYAGLADAALGGRLGTTMSGSIDETAQSDGTAIVKVVLHSQNALAFAVQGFDFNGPLLFGNRVAEVLAGAQPSVGSCTLKLTFRNSAPGAQLPDIEELVLCRFDDLISISFVGQANGTLTDGESGQLQVTQVGLLHAFAQANPNSRVALDAFPAEHINIRPSGR
jgi:hypothetical protein